MVAHRFGGFIEEQPQTIDGRCGLRIERHTFGGQIAPNFFGIPLRDGGPAGIVGVAFTKIPGGGLVGG